jgi:succinate dehydrogenase/fumarate reductase-like Fe-S protein
MLLSPQRPVSVAVPVWQPVKTVRPCYSFRQKPQGAPERKTRVLNMVAQMDREGFGSCTFTGACEAVCPKEISITNISRLNGEYISAGLSSE